jgi:hypothetical protein
MKAIHRGALALISVVVGAGMLAGCTSSTQGAPTPSGSQQSSGSQGPTATGSSGASSSPAADATLAAVDPCSLLTTAEATQFGAQGPGEPADTRVAGSTSACKWHGRTASDDAITFGLDIRASQGIDELRANGGTITDGKVGNRSARSLPNGNMGCIVTLKVGAKSRVDVTTSTLDDPCGVAGKVAGFVEPRLPPEQN